MNQGGCFSAQDFGDQPVVFDDFGRRRQRPGVVAGAQRASSEGIWASARASDLTACSWRPACCSAMARTTVPVPGVKCQTGHLLRPVDRVFWFALAVRNQGATGDEPVPVLFPLWSGRRVSRFLDRQLGQLDGAGHEQTDLADRFGDFGVSRSSKLVNHLAAKFPVSVFVIGEQQRAGGEVPWEAISWSVLHELQIVARAFTPAAKSSQQASAIKILRGRAGVRFDLLAESRQVLCRGNLSE